MTRPETCKSLLSDSLKAAIAGIRAVRAKKLVVDSLQGYDFGSADRIFGVCVGKAAAAMHAGLMARVPLEKWRGGIVVTLQPTEVPGAQNIIGSHPIPTEKSRLAAAAVFQFIRAAQLTRADLVVVCVSGGTSAMLAAPIAGVTLADMAEVNRQLLRSGLDVTEMNSVRQALSSIHGGGLARACRPAHCLGLILCDDVQVGAPMVGSGPTFVPGPIEKAEAIIREHLSPPEFQDHLLQCLHPFPPTPNASNITVGGPADAVRGAAAWAERRGYRPFLVSDALQGEAAEMVKYFSGPPELVDGRYCLLAAGEVTVTVRGPGAGGRCQEFAWAMAREIAGQPAVFLALGTDGCDHLPGIAGAWVDGDTLEKIKAQGLDWRSILDSNDSYSGLSRLNQLIHSKGTGTNVCDLYLLFGTARKNR
jgi:glycerate 2-kinase